MPALTGKTVVVTGASRGIGLEFVKQLASKGNKIFATCRHPEAARENIQRLDGDISVLQLDVSSPTSIENWASEIQHLTPHVDLLINNAGIYGDRVNLDTVSAEGMLQVFQTNAIGPLLIVQQLRKRGLLGGGSGAGKSTTIVANLTSKVASVDDNKSGGGYAYRSSKIALNMITKSLSIDLASENVVATLLHPGWVQTDMTKGSGLITAEHSVAGMLAVLENHSEEELQGSWRDYKNEVIAW